MAIAASLSTHVLNLDAGAPAENLSIDLHRTDLEGNNSEAMGSYTTDQDGRVSSWPALDSGSYALCFQVGEWYQSMGIECFYPRIRIEFNVDTQRHYHVPLLLNRFGFSSYRGS